MTENKWLIPDDPPPGTSRETRTPFTSDATAWLFAIHYDGEAGQWYRFPDPIAHTNHVQQVKKLVKRFEIGSYKFATRITDDGIVLYGRKEPT